MKLRLLPAAYEEFRDAARWYDEQQPGVGRRFSRAVVEQLKQVREHPERYAIYEGKKVEGEYRRIMVPGFAYILVYRIEQEVTVVACQHASRAPGYWEGR